MDMNPDNNLDTFRGRGHRIKELEEQVEQLKQELLYKQQRFDKLWDICSNVEFTYKALTMFEEWEDG